MKFLTVLIMLSASILVTGCSEKSESGTVQENKQKKQDKKEHVWQQQTDSLKKSKEVGQQLQKSLDQHKKQLDQSN